ncbi:hypothetical protein ACQKOE_02970 [Novosphingobium sp. NPDC080210]|uniref:hypothetical protein n=1 Tax=Novosphingobium sp. NPDC080210 TaxID=3390596 RepID=UPI003D056061
MLFAIPDHPWVDEKDGAAVRIAMTVAAKSKEIGVHLIVTDESGAPDEIDFAMNHARIGSNLGTGADVTSAITLKANSKLASRGIPLHGQGFLLDSDDVAFIGFRASPELPEIVVPYRNGRDLAARPRGKWVIDTYGLSESDLRERYPNAYQRLLTHVKPERDQNKRGHRAEKWWLHGEPVEMLRQGRRGLNRYIATVETAKHRVFQFLPTTILPDNMLVCIAMEDAYALGVLSSRASVVWALAAGGDLGPTPRYNKSACFDPFPFPADGPEPLKERIRAEAEALDALRKRVLAEHDDLTLTGIYNVLEALREGRALSAAEREVHDRGLVTLIRQHHDAIDALVAQAYGWPADLPDEEVLLRLVALNKARAAEEAKGLVRWLRPEFQAPGYAAPIAQTLDLGEVAAPLPDNVIPWPAKLEEQVCAVQAILTTAPAPLAPQDIARAFRGKRAATVRPVLDALAGIGMARRLHDGRYAA